MRRSRRRSGRLDELMKSGRLPPPSLLKIDVEWAEIGVLAGARATLVKYRPLVLCELHHEEADRESRATSGSRLFRRGSRPLARPRPDSWRFTARYPAEQDPARRLGGPRGRLVFRECAMLVRAGYSVFCGVCRAACGGRPDSAAGGSARSTTRP